jgi:excisionase family DNA binding protein
MARQSSFRDHLADNLAGMQPILVPVPQASAILGKSPRAIYELMASGQLKAVKSGRNTLVVYESLKEYVANLPAPKLRRQQREVA